MSSEENKKQSNGLVIALLIALVLALVGLVIISGLVFVRGGGSEVEPTAPPEVAPTTAPPDAVDPTATGAPVVTSIPLTPEPSVPSGTVIAPDGVNIRFGPGTNYPILARAPFGAKFLITGVSSDGGWWVGHWPEAPNNQGWVDARFIEAEDAENAPIVPAPPVPVTPTPLPPIINSFTLAPNPISEGQCTTIQWNVGGGATRVRIIKNGVNVLVDGTELAGELTDCPNSAGAKSYRLEAGNDAGLISSQEIILTVQEVNPLAGANWTLSSMNVNQLLLPETTITIFFGSDGAVSGVGGCNAYSGSYTVSGSSIAISPVGAGESSCGADVDQQEETYFSLLLSANNFAIEGDQLILKNGDQEVLRFNRS